MEIGPLTETEVREFWRLQRFDSQRGVPLRELQSVRCRVRHAGFGAENSLLSLKGAIGVGVGLRQKDGVMTVELVIQVAAERKLAKKSLPGGQLIPNRIQGYKTDKDTKRMLLKLVS